MEAFMPRSRSPSPPSSNDSPVYSHSSPDSSDFPPADSTLASAWKPSSQLTPSNGYAVQSMLKSAAPANIWNSSGLDYSATLARNEVPRLKADHDHEGVIFSEFIQEDAFDPTPLSAMSPLSAYSMGTNDGSQHYLFSQPSGNYDLSTALNLAGGQAYPPSAPQPSLVPSRTMIHPQPQPHPRAMQTTATLPSSGSSSSSSLPSHYRTTASENGPVFPPRASCTNLPIHITNLPERGAKSRVETQIKMDLELVKPSTANEGSSTSYRPVASWKWLRLNKGAATKRRPKKDVKQESTIDDTLFLSTEVTCSSPPNIKVHACSNCIAREAKRVERKKATRVRPMRSESDDESNAVPNVVADQIKAEEAETDDGSRIVLFNCPELLDFSSGTASLPVRITCYCRHHREKVGFKITFTLRDASGRVVGRGTSPPVMITDDHKSTQKNSGNGDDDEEEAELPTPQQKRKRRSTKKESSAVAEQDGDVMMDGHAGTVDEEEIDETKAKRRYRRGGSPAAILPPPRKQSVIKGTASGRSSRRGTPSRRSSPSSAAPVPPMVSRNAAIQALSNIASYSTSQSNGASPYDFNAMAAIEEQQHQPPTQSELDAVLLASMDVLNSQMMSPTHSMTGVEQPSPYFPMLGGSTASPSAAVTAPGSPSTTTRLGSPLALDSGLGILAGSLLSANLFPSAVPSRGASTPNLLAPSNPSSLLTSTIPPTTALQADPPTAPPPVIHRLIPNSGPTHGGIEVTILGANFVHSLRCVFGNAVAPSTTMWSENTIVCVLPPSPTGGPVPVWFEDVPMEVDLLGGAGPAGIQFFTYLDHSDRALMELALQVVGMQMTGRVEDARNVAMRIVGNTSSMDMSGGGGGSSAGGGQTMNTLAAHLTNPTRSRDFQSVVIEFLSLVDVQLEDHQAPVRMAVEDAISMPNPTGQTLLHLAAILGFHRLVTFLLDHGADIDARDNNGFTALHFAATCGRLASARTLVNYGADLEVVEALGRTARQMARLHDQADVEMLLEETENVVSNDGDASAEEEEEDEEEVDEEGLWMGRRASTGESSESVTPQTMQPSRVPSRKGSQVAFTGLPDVVPGAASDLYSDEDDAAKTPEPRTSTVPVRPIQHPDAPSPVIGDDGSATWLSRTWKHLQPPPKMVPELPWALPNFQVPGIAFPMQVPSWTTGTGEKVRTYYDLASLKAWYAGPAVPPPMYTPSADEVAPPVVFEETPASTGSGDDASVGSGPSKAIVRAKLARRLGFDPGHVTDREVNAYAYYSKKMRKLKQDRMLVLFWLPILLIVFAWGVYESLPALAAAKSTIENFLPFRDPLHA